MKENRNDNSKGVFCHSNFSRRLDGREMPLKFTAKAGDLSMTTTGTGSDGMVVAQHVSLVSLALRQGKDCPNAFVCPLSQDVMRHPVKSLLSGYSFERRELVDWFMTTAKARARDPKSTGSGYTCPITKQVFGEGDLVPDDELQTRIQIWCSSNGYVLSDVIPGRTMPSNDQHEDDLLKTLVQEAEAAAAEYIHHLKSAKPGGDAGLVNGLPATGPKATAGDGHKKYSPLMYHMFHGQDVFPASS